MKFIKNFKDFNKVFYKDIDSGVPYLYNKSMSKKNITTDELARMVKKGFDGVTKEMRSGFKQVDRRFDKIEKLILTEHRHRIEKLELKVARLEELLVVK